MTYPRHLVFVSIAALAFAGSVRAEDQIDFSRDILPLLSDRCFNCHGPDEANREGGLRLDKQESAFAKLESGHSAVVAKKSQQSALYQRITSQDPDSKMPPADSGKTLSAEEIDRIKRWIDQGAEWSGHWAFKTPVKPPVPASVPGWRAENPVDLFIHRRLFRAKLAPEQRANKETLIRRVTLDLTGLPPTLREVDDFLADKSPAAYERIVDRLLNSHRYGEHMARIWLDAARYADTHGLHLDNERSIWPYRDWVIAAYNRNQPFDQFTIEQLAGDLLPNPTLPQRVATGFNRCNVTTSEGGSIDAEYYVRYAVDRVETTSTVWMGLTAGCAVCHDHKFDPLTQKEFYQLFSYFYSLTERAMDGNAMLPPPTVKVPSAESAVRKERLQKQLSEIDQQIAATLSGLKYTDPMLNQKLPSLGKKEIAWIDDALPQGAKPAGDGPNPWKFVDAPAHPVFSGKKSTVRTAKGLSQHFFTEASPTLKLGANDHLFAYVYLDPKDPPQTIQLQFNDGTWEHRAFWGADKAHGAGKNNASNRRLGDLPAAGKWVRLEVPIATVGLKAGSQLNGWAFTQFDGTVHWDKAGVVSLALTAEQQESLFVWEQFRKQTKSPAIPAEIQKVLDIGRDKRSSQQTKQLTQYFLRHVRPSSRKLFEPLTKKQTDIKNQISAVEKAIPATLVMQDRPTPRQAFVLERGQYTAPKDKVSSRIPDWIAPAVPDAPGNRLGLAKWLVSPKHPLTARVAVNRIWQQYFGVGLVTTSEDFGVQGDRPSHPQLLDWIAVDFVESGWDVKRLHKMLVMSATYQQSSRVTPSKLAADPQNRLLARGPRFRLDAETIRDQALAISGLMVNTIGGKSVRPYQPAGLWKPVGFGGSNTSVFRQDKGDKLYRRSMYTFWKRTSPPPSMSAFDAPNRETCSVRRARTNTPLQALVLMNDVQMVEAARKLAERILKEGGSSVEQQAIYAFRSATARRPNERELRLVVGLLDEYLRSFQRDAVAANKLLSAGESGRDMSLDVAELSAWTMIAHLLLNLSEIVTKG